MIVGTAVRTILVGTIVPIMFVGTKISLAAVPTTLVGTAVTTINVGTTVPTMILRTKLSLVVIPTTFVGIFVPTNVGTTVLMDSLNIGQFNHKTLSKVCGNEQKHYWGIYGQPHRMLRQ